MKSRHSIIYLLILLLLGGYFYYVEVVSKNRREVSEAEAKRVFQFRVDDVQALEISSSEKKPVRLEKGEEWRILEPVKAGVDRGTLINFLNSFAAVKVEREVVASPGELKPYGLEEPSLRIRAKVGEGWVELLLGERNPAGDLRYGKVGNVPRVFLVSEGNWSALNKGSNDLRKRELFTFAPDEVIGMRVQWQEGGSFRLERAHGNAEWRTPDNPELNIKKGKIDNVLEQIHWLRAQNFIDDETATLESQGLKPPHVAVDLMLKGDRTAELRLSKSKEGEKQALAFSSELKNVVQVNDLILEEIPKKVEALEDRSLLTLAPADIKEVKWQFDGSSGHVVQMDDTSWGIKQDDKAPEKFQDSWRVKSLLWNLGDVEYLKRMQPGDDSASDADVRLEIRGSEDSAVILGWKRTGEQTTDPVRVRIEGAGKSDVVLVDLNAMKTLEKDLEQLRQVGRAAEAS
jgi:hypothetical protein